MPQEVYDMYSKLKSGFSVNFFHKEFAKEIVAELDRLGFQVELKGEQVAAEIQKRKSSKTTAKTSDAPAKKSKLKSVLSRLSGSAATRTAAAREGTLDKTGTDPVREAARRAGRK